MLGERRRATFAPFPRRSQRPTELAPAAFRRPRPCWPTTVARTPAYASTPERSPRADHRASSCNRSAIDGIAAGGGHREHERHGAQRGEPGRGHHAGGGIHSSCQPPGCVELRQDTRRGHVALARRDASARAAAPALAHASTLSSRRAQQVDELPRARSRGGAGRRRLYQAKAAPPSRSTAVGKNARRQARVERHHRGEPRHRAEHRRALLGHQVDRRRPRRIDARRAERGPAAVTALHVAPPSVLRYTRPSPAIA